MLRQQAYTRIMDKFIMYQSERAVYLNFCSLFRTQYVRHLNETKTLNDSKNSEISTVLKNFKQIQLLLDSNAQVKNKYFLIIPAFLSLLIDASKDYLLSFNVHYEVAKYLH